MLLDKLKKQMAKELMKVNNVHCLLGSKKVPACLAKVDDDMLSILIKYKYKGKNRLVFKSVHLINSDTDETIQIRDIGLRELTKGDRLTLEWNITIEQLSR